MANTVKYAPTLYSSPPKNAIPGARLEYREMEIATTVMLTTNIFALGILPAGHRLNYFAVESDDLDGATSAAISVGLLNSYYNEPVATATVVGWDGSPGPELVAGYDDSDGETGSSNINLLLAASATPVQAGGRAIPAVTLAYAMDIGVDKIHDRIIAFKFTTVPGTAVAGKVAFIVGMDWD